jgi:hypothetical protein
VREGWGGMGRRGEGEGVLLVSERVHSVQEVFTTAWM